MWVGQIDKKKWLKAGNQNSKFFYAVINACQHKASITTMKLDDGTMLESPEEVHEDAVKHFQKFLFEANDRENSDLRHLLSKVITEKDNACFMVRPTEDELKAAVKSIPINRSPGLDGFGFGFYLTCWEFLKDDLLEAATEFFNGAVLPRFFTTSFIVLIPKLENPSSFKNFRPISLCSVACKILQDDC